MAARTALVGVIRFYLSELGYLLTVYYTGSNVAYMNTAPATGTIVRNSRTGKTYRTSGDAYTSLDGKLRVMGSLIKAGQVTGYATGLLLAEIVEEKG